MELRRDSHLRVIFYENTTETNKYDGSLSRLPNQLYKKVEETLKNITDPELLQTLERGNCIAGSFGYNIFLGTNADNLELVYTDKNTHGGIPRIIHEIARELESIPQPNAQHQPQ